MFNVIEVKGSFIELVGFRSSGSVDGYSFPDNFSSPSTGLFVNAIDSELNLKNIISHYDLAVSQDEFKKSFEEDVGDIVVQVVNDWVNRKQMLNTARILLNAGQLFDASGNMSDVESLPEKSFVGFEIRIIGDREKLVRIPQVILQFSEAQNVTLNLYEEGKLTGTAVTGAALKMSRSIIESDSLLLKGGRTYYLGYFSDSITGDYINGVKRYDYNSSGASLFPHQDLNHFRVRAFQVTTSGVELWDLRDMRYSLDTNYGIDFRYSVECDYTDFLIEQRDKFGLAVQTGVAYYLKTSMLKNPNSRFNRSERVFSVNDDLLALQGDTRGRNDFSVWGRYTRALDAIAFDRSMISQDCLTCRRRRVRNKAIGPRR